MRVPSGRFSAIIPMAQIKKKLLDNGVPQAMIDLMPQQVFDGLSKVWSIVPPTDEDVVRIMRDGKPEYYRVHDQLSSQW